MTSIDNPIVNHKHARWIALGCYIGGFALLQIGSTIKDPLISYILMSSCLIIWAVPVMWVAKKWSESK